MSGELVEKENIYSIASQWAIFKNIGTMENLVVTLVFTQIYELVHKKSNYIYVYIRYKKQTNKLKNEILKSCRL